MAGMAMRLSMKQIGNAHCRPAINLALTGKPAALPMAITPLP